MGEVNWQELRQAAGDGGFTVMPPGEYDVYVHSATAGQTSTAKDRIRVTFKIESGPQQGQPIVNDFVISTDNSTAMSIFFRHMAVLGLDEAYFAANARSQIEKLASDLQEKRARCRLRTSTRTWNGEPRTNVDQVLPPMPGTSPAMPPSPVPHASATPVPSVTPASRPAPSSAAGPSVPSLPDDLPF